MAKKLLFPDDVRKLLRRRYASQHRSWLVGGGAWPLSVALSNMTERDVVAAVSLVRSWVAAWSEWRGDGEVSWSETQWKKLGTQRLPTHVHFSSATEVAGALDESARFLRATSRYEECFQRWSHLRGSKAMAADFDVFADYSDADFQRLLALVSWILDHPNSGCFVRQLPIAGLHTKWIDRRRRGLVTTLLAAIRGESTDRDFYEACGLRRPPHRLRLRVLCPGLRQAIGGLGDIEAPIEELNGLPLAPSRVIVVENLESGLALPELPGCVAFMKLGHAVSVLASLRWLTGARMVYWGDIDTHGLVILDRVRATFDNVTSVLMDESTLLAHRSLWTEEPSQHAGAELPQLSAAERRLFDKLHSHEWSRNVRLEQERIPWPEAIAAVSKACSISVSPTD